MVKHKPLPCLYCSMYFEDYEKLGEHVKVKHEGRVEIDPLIKALANV